MKLRLGLVLMLMCVLIASPVWADNTRQNLIEESTLDQIIEKTKSGSVFRPLYPGP